MDLKNMQSQRRKALTSVISTWRSINPTDVTDDHVDEFRKWVEEKLNIENLSPSQIKKLIGCKHSEFGSFIKTSLGLSLKSRSSAMQNRATQQGRRVTDAKKRYWNACKFVFDPYLYTWMPGYELLFTHKWYSATNTDGICRDHMFSIYEGWIKNIDPSIISHPANCHIMIAKNNHNKNTASSITLEELMKRIENWETGVDVPILQRRSLPKSLEHRRKISESLKKKPITEKGRKRKNDLNHINWISVSQDLLSGLSRRDILEKYGITVDQYHRARKYNYLYGIPNMIHT